MYYSAEKYFPSAELWGIPNAGYADFLLPTKTLRTTGDLEIGGAFVLAGSITMQANLIIDVDNAEALLVRQDADAADVLTVNTIVPGVLIGGTLSIASTVKLKTNDSWIIGRNAADDADINMFKINTSDEIDVGAQLNIGPISFIEDAGVVTAMDMPVSSASPDGLEMSYTFKIDGTNVLKIYGESDGAGGADELRVVTANLKVNGAFGNTAQQTITLGNGAITFAVTSNVVTVTGDGGGNTIGTITGAHVGLYTFIFVDALVTITDTDVAAADTIDLVGTAANFASADDSVLQLVYDGTSWFQTSASVN